MTNRNRKGHYAHSDCEPRSKSDRRAFRDAESQLIYTFLPIVIETGAQDLRASEIADLRAKAATTKSAFNRRIFEQEIERLSR